MKTKDAINIYLTHCTNIKKLEPLTLKAYLIDLKQFNNFAESIIESVDKLDKTLLSKYIDFIATKYKAKSLKRKVASLKAFFNFLEFEDFITVTPFRKIKLNIKEPKRLPKSLSLFDMEKLLSYLYLNSANNFADIRNRAIFELLFATGIRISELCNICLTDVNIESQIIAIKGKGNKERLVFISNTYIFKAIQSYINMRPASDNTFLFINRLGNKISTQSVRYFIESLCKKVLNKHITPHMIRHTFATLMLEEGVDLMYIKSFLGHSSISTTQIYTASTTYKQKQILATLHPRNRIHICN